MLGPPALKSSKMSSYAPFSARNRGAFRRIENDFPQSARIGLLHLIVGFYERDYVGAWPVVARELQRIARIPPVTYSTSSSTSIAKAKQDVEELILNLSWEKSFDFCERLHSHLAQDVTGWNDNELELITAKTEVQKSIALDLQRLFEEEQLAFEFTAEGVQRQGRRHTVELAARAQTVLGDPRFTGSRKHFEKALRFFRATVRPDYENCVKESVCAVEAAGRALFPNSNAKTLGELSKWLKVTEEVDIPVALTKVIDGIYGYRSGGEGIGHGGAVGGAATAQVAELILAVCASLIIFLRDLSDSIR